MKYLPHYTFVDYSQWQGDWELWEGMPVAMTPSPFGPHQLVSARLARQIGNQLENCGCGCEVLHEIDWIINSDTIVRPDLVVVCDGIPEHHIERPPVLVAEIISPSTEHKDRTAKYNLYESQAVKFYVLVDSTKKMIQIFALSSTGKYDPLTPSDVFQLKLLPNCQIQINPTKLF